MSKSLLQLSQQVFVELVQLRQVVQDLIEDPLIHHRLSILTGCLGNCIPKVLKGHTWVLNSVVSKQKHTHTHTWSCPDRVRCCTGTPGYHLINCLPLVPLSPHTSTCMSWPIWLSALAPSSVPIHTRTWKEAGRLAGFERPGSLDFIHSWNHCTNHV